MDGGITVFEVYQLCTDIKYVVDLLNSNSDDGLLEVLETFTDGESTNDIEKISDELVTVLETFTDGETNNDLELQLADIKNSLMYNEDVTALSEISQRLEVIDTRLDREFITLNDCFSFICTALLCFISFKFFNWLFRAFSV